MTITNNFNLFHLKTLIEAPMGWRDKKLMLHGCVSHTTGVSLHSQLPCGLIYLLKCFSLLPGMTQFVVCKSIFVENEWIKCKLLLGFASADQFCLATAKNQLSVKHKLPSSKILNNFYQYCGCLIYKFSNNVLKYFIKILAYSK